MIGISGASGYIGSSLIKSLKSKNFLLLEHNKKLNFKEIEYKKIKKKDLNNPKTIKLYYKKIKFFIHLSSKYEDSKKIDNFFIKNNLIDSINIFNFCKKIKVEYFININTALDYRINRYTMTKEFFAMWAQRFNDNEVKFINLMPDIIYGERNNGFTNFIIQSLKSKKDLQLTKCEQKRNFLHVKDFCNSIKFIFDNRNEIKNNDNLYIYSKNTLKLKDYVLKIKRIFDSMTKDRYQKKVNFGSIPLRNFEKINIKYKKSHLFKKFNEKFSNLDVELKKIVKNEISNLN